MWRSFLCEIPADVEAIFPGGSLICEPPVLPINQIAKHAELEFGHAKVSPESDLTIFCFPCPKEDYLLTYLHVLPRKKLSL